MNQPTEAQKQCLWEQCGFYQDSKTYHFDMTVKEADWYCPDGSLSYSGGSWKWKGRLPDPDLNNLFKYAVSKVCVWEIGDNMLTIKGQGKPLEPDTEDDKAWWEVTIGGCERDEIVVEDEDPALALFWAIFAVFEKHPLELEQYKAFGGNK